MAEILGEISAEVKQFFDTERTPIDVQHSMHRTTVIDMDGTGVSIEQTKYIAPEELKVIRAKGAQALATVAWFNDVEWLEHPGERDNWWQNLNLDAKYPLDYFEDRPTSGTFSGENWLDQYGSISGFGNEEINTWLLEFIAKGERKVTRLRYPGDPTALDAYNARYRQHLEDLDTAHPTISYYQAWDRIFSNQRQATPLVLGGLSLGGFSINEVLEEGMPSTGSRNTNNTRVVLHYEPEQDGYVGRDIIIVGDEATTQPYWDGEDDEEQASDELLETTLELIRSENSV